MYTPFMRLCAYFIITFMFILGTAEGALAGYFEQGTHYYIRKNYEKAREYFQKAGELGDGNAYYFLGEIEKNSGNYDRALEYYTLATSNKISKKYYNLAYWNMIILTEQKGNYPDMVKKCKEFWERTGDESARTKVETVINRFLWTDNQEAKDEYQRGIELKNAEKFTEAEDAMRNAIQKEQAFLAPRFELSLLLLKKNSTSEALRHLGEILSRVPFYGEVHLLMGDIHLQRGEHSTALDHFTSAMEFGLFDRNTRYLIYTKKASCNYNLREYDDARADIEAALKLNPKAIEPLYLLSAIDIKQENYDDALGTLEKARQIDPENAEIYFQMGSIQYKTGSGKYIASFEKLFDLLSGSQDEIPAKYAKAVLMLAKHYYSKDQYERVETVTEAVPDKHRDGDSLVIFARSCYQLGKNDKALRNLEKVPNLKDEDRYLLCRLYAMEGKKERSQRILQGFYSGPFFDKAKKDPVLRDIATAIEEEKKKSIEVKQ